MTLRITMRPRTSRPKRRKARSISTSGSVTDGRSCFAPERLHTGLHPELGAVAGLKQEFDRRNCKIMGISVDGVDDHEAWSKDIEASQGHALNYPLIGDPELKVVKLYDMLPGEAGDTCEGRTPADNATARSVFVIGPTRRSRRRSRIR